MVKGYFGGSYSVVVVDGWTLVMTFYPLSVVEGSTTGGGSVEVEVVYLGVVSFLGRVVWLEGAVFPTVVVLEGDVTFACFSG